MDALEPIDLARGKPFALGPLTVRPATRELIGPDGESEVLEPRVMQVLVALARAGGEILTRDDLTALCWEGRIVGEDAINRVISRLRRSAEGIGQGAFRVETITKVGYRLAGEGVAGLEASVASAPGEATEPKPPNRRGLLIGGGVAALAVAAGAGSWLVWRERAGPRLPADVQALYDQAWVAIEYTSTEQNSAAIGLLRQVTEKAPDFADGWGSLAYAYNQSSIMSAPAVRESFRTRARSASAKTLQLDPDNVIAGVVEVAKTPIWGEWRRAELELRALLAKHPGAQLVQQNLGMLMASVGRVEEGAILNARAIRTVGQSPTLFFRHIAMCMSCNRLEEADRMAERAIALYPRQYAVWFSTFYLYLYTGRAEQALAMAADTSNRPPGIPSDEFDRIAAVATAVLSGKDRDIDAAIAPAAAFARKGAGYAENAILFASFLGRLDTAFEIAQAYYFRRGFDPGARSFSDEQGYYYRNPRTHILFQLPAAAMRADGRFDGLVEEIGLKRYWAESKSLPDYLRKPA